MRNLKKHPHMDDPIYVRRRKVLTALTAIPGLFLMMADSESFLAFVIAKVIAIVFMAMAVVLYNTLPGSEEED